MSSHRNVNSGKPNEKSHPISSHRNVNSENPTKNATLLVRTELKFWPGWKKTHL